MGRESFLFSSLRNWLNFESISEIIIVDWSCAKEIHKHEMISSSKKIKVIRVDGMNRWILSWAYNLGMSLSSNKSILKLDCDISLSPSFFENYILNKNIFFRGSWKVAREENEHHLNGQFFCHKKHLEDVNFFNERIVSYGWDDDDLYHRLKSVGLKEYFLNPKHIMHSENSNKDRVMNQPEFSNVSELDLESALKYKIIKNEAFAKSKPWSNRDLRKNWSIEKKYKNYWEAKII